jgi:pyruvate dehydrogenase (quinone)
MAKTTAQVMVERLIEWGVDTIFGYPGDGVNGIFEALRNNQEKMRFIQVRHEEAAAFAACGYAKYTGRIGVCLATSGPGGIHLLNGLYDAKCDGAPVLAITGHTFHDMIGTHYQQDVDLDKVYQDVAIYNQRVTGPDHIVNVLDEAIKAALTHRGVAHLTIPKDVQSWTSDSKRSPANVKQHSGDIYDPPMPVPSRELLSRAAEVINEGKKVAILVGRGCLHAGPEVIELSRVIAGPIIKALLGKAVVPDRDPYTTGGVGLLGTAPSADALQECDTLIIAGSSFPYIEFYPKPGKARIVQMDLDSARIGLRCPVDVGLAGDCRAILKALLPLLDRKADQSFIEKCQKNMQHWREVMTERGERMDVPIKPQAVAYRLNRLIEPDAIVTTDSGTVSTWAARYIDIQEDMKFSLSGSLATMANGLPYSIGAAIAYPNRQVICFIGDGALTMLMGELATLVKYHLNVKVIVIKNNTLGQIKWEQIAMEGNPEFGVDLQPIDFAGVAMNCGVAGFTVENPGELDETLRRALEHTGPALVQVVVDPNEPPMPGNVTTEQALKFAEAIIRGQRDGWKILKDVLKEQVREVI